MAASEDCEEKKRKVDLMYSALAINAPLHTSQVAMAAVTKCSFEVLPHPLYSPDLALSDFCLFPYLKTNLCGRRQ